LKERLGKEWLVQLEVIDSLRLWRPLDKELCKVGVAAYFSDSGFIGISSKIYQELLPHIILKDMQTLSFSVSSDPINNIID
jgi:hypothetical protein